MRTTPLLPVLTLALLLGAPIRLAAQAAYTPPAENLAAREWFQDARFGLFNHWGVYSVLGAGEWVMHNRQMRVSEYERLPALFNPIPYDPAEWVALAKAAGMRYITVTTRHHDGFAMFDSRVPDYSVVRRTPYGRDVIAMLVEAARKEGIKVFFYYSQLDWHHPDYYPRGFTGQHAGRPDSGRFARYVDFMNAQLRELLTNYGPIGGIWFDGMWDRPEHDWRLADTYGLIHQLQPATLIIPNHHQAPLPGEDAQTFEKDPGQIHYSSFWDSSYDEDGDDETVSQAATFIQKEKPDFLFLYIGTVDTAGHRHGWMLEGYLRQLEHIDSLLGGFFEGLPHEYTAILHSDHGGHDRSHGTDMDEDMIIPWMAVGPHIKKGYTIHSPVTLLDTAPTNAKLLEIKAHPEWEGMVCGGYVYCVNTGWHSGQQRQHC